MHRYTTYSTAYIDTVESPAGPIAFAVNADGALVCVKFLEGMYERTLEHDLERVGYIAAVDERCTAAAHQQFTAYAAGTRHTFDLPLALIGTEWQVAVWQALTAIPYGETRTYGQIAAQIGRPAASRAVGRANATNRIPLVVPCHRVIGASGALTGFAGGLNIKERLLAHEMQQQRVVHHG